MTAEVRCLHGGVYSSSDRVFCLYDGNTKSMVGSAKWEVRAYPTTSCRLLDYYINNVKSVSKHINIPLANYEKLSTLTAIRIFEFVMFNESFGSDNSFQLLNKTINKIDVPHDLIWIAVDDDNQGAVKVCERAGFIQAGHSNSLLMIAPKRAKA